MGGGIFHTCVFFVYRKLSVMMIWMSCPCQWLVSIEQSFDRRVGGVSYIIHFLEWFQLCKSPYPVCDNIFQWWRFNINQGFYPPTLSKCIYLGIRNICIHEVHVYSLDTDVLLMALSSVPKRDTKSAVIIGNWVQDNTVVTWCWNHIMSNLVQKSISALANQLSCANRVRYNNWRHIQGN